MGEHMDIVYDVLDFFRAGFDQVNAVQGLIIALVASLLLRQWSRLPLFALASAVIHVGVDIMLPVLASGASFSLPDILHLYFWRYLATLVAGYLVVIAVLVLIWKLVLKR